MAEKTPEEILEEQRKTAENAASGAEHSILDAIMDFIKFLFEGFFTNKEAPNENGVVEAPETLQERVKATQLIIDSQAIPKWRAFMEAHKGEAVIHTSPVRGDSQITSNFGHRDTPTAGASHDHKGLDLGKRGDDTITATAAGVVLFSGKKSGYGNTVIIGHADGSQTLYGHMTGANMPVLGSEVMQGEAIGIMGATGTATGVHLHYEQRKGTTALDPVINGKHYHEGDKVLGAGPQRLSEAKVTQNETLLALTLPAGLTKLFGIDTPAHAHEDTLATTGNSVDPASRAAVKS